MSVIAPNAHYFQCQLTTTGNPGGTYAFSDAKAENNGWNEKSPRKIREVDNDP